MPLILAHATLPVAATHGSILTGRYRSPQGRCRVDQTLSHFQKRPAVTILLTSPVVTIEGFSDHAFCDFAFRFAAGGCNALRDRSSSSRNHFRRATKGGQSRRLGG